MQKEAERKQIVGRFAPSPTGPLHFGSLVAALGSYLLAKQSGGRWLLRVEDLDPPRVVPGAADAMLQLLERLGFEWDGAVIFQSQRYDRYRQILEQLHDQGLLFECTCSRRELIASAPHPGEDGPVYPGSCRQGPVGARPERALRLRVADDETSFQDKIFGLVSQNLERDVGDFVLQRADGLYAYQLAVVIDDIDSGVNQVVRGADLLSSTPRQIYLYQCLGERYPDYYHLPLALGEDAEKLSKRHGRAGEITLDNCSLAVWFAYQFLGQDPPVELKSATAPELLQWGRENFSLTKVTVAPRSAPKLAAG